MAILFSIFSIIFYFGDWFRLCLVFFLGIFIGALAIPEFEPKAIKKPVLFQTIVGTIGGCVAGIIFTNNLDYIIGSSFIGAVIGFSANYWVKHVPIP